MNENETTCGGTGFEPCGGGATGGPSALPEGHVVRTLMEEHQRILGHLNQLETLASAGRPEPGDPQGRTRLQEIRGIGTHLVGAEPHHQREEQVLFPALVQRGIQGPPTVMEAEHVELRALKHAVTDHATQMLHDGVDRWTELRRDAMNLVHILRDHIAKEDTILYPMALRLITDPAEWEDMKRRCDEVGYCCHG